jgi:hypothetical protein
MTATLPSAGVDVDAIPHAYSLFQQPWWLDAVAPGAWRAAEVRRGDELLARMPYVIGRRHGLSTLTMPALTPVLGPWVRASDAKYSNRLSEQHELLEELLLQLPPVDLFRHGFAPEVENWLPFYWHGCEATPAYTFRIESLEDPDQVWAGFRESVRREIRKAQKVVTVRDDLPIERFYELQQSTFARQGLPVPFGLDYLRRIDEAAVRRGARRMLFAEDASGRTHAAVYVVWDARVAYYLLGGGDPELRTSGAHSLLMWEAIRFASGVSRCFDFEGSMLRHVERFVRGFGGRMVPYYVVSRMSARMRLIAEARRLASAVRRPRSST